MAWPDSYCPSNPESYRILFDILDEYIEGPGLTVVIGREHEHRAEGRQHLDPQTGGPDHQDDLPCVPEISANKYMLNIRFIHAGSGALRTCTGQSIDFDLTFCTL